MQNVFFGKNFNVHERPLSRNEIEAFIEYEVEKDMTDREFEERPERDRLERIREYARGLKGLDLLNQKH